MTGAALTMALAAFEAELAHRFGQRGRAKLGRRHCLWAIVIATVAAANGIRHLSTTWISG